MTARDEEALTVVALVVLLVMVSGLLMMAVFLGVVVLPVLLALSFLEE